MLQNDNTKVYRRTIRSREEVCTFLNQAKTCLDDDWAGGRVNKTQAFLAERNLSDNDVAEVIRELQVANYCYTEDDRNNNFVNETFWFFGMTRFIIDSEEKMYIKLKIRKLKRTTLLVMSFHPEQPAGDDDELAFPYKN